MHIKVIHKKKCKNKKRIFKKLLCLGNKNKRDRNCKHKAELIKIILKINKNIIWIYAKIKKFKMIRLLLKTKKLNRKWTCL